MSTSCFMALVLALDVSGSVDMSDYALQREGFSAAFSDPEIIALIEQLPGGVAIATTTWADATDQHLTFDWAMVNSAETSLNMSRKFNGLSRLHTGPFTAVGSALKHANAQFSRNPFNCMKNVIDISSDGKNNAGLDEEIVANQVGLSNTMINALVIEHAQDDLRPYYEERIIRGPGSFVISAKSYSDYAEAIKNKLELEFNLIFASDWSSSDWSNEATNAILSR
ncbi:MAG: DUF1194 domain-containing protein [Alphaproteobacteria bacterium]